MKKIIAAIAVVILISSFASCRLNYESPETVMSQLDSIAGKIGNSQITADETLIGTRNNAEDEYTGEYRSMCDGQTGRDVIFGGGSIEKRCVRIHGHIGLKSGEATVRIRMNSVATELQTDEKGYFETVLDMSSGGNYIMVDYKNFSGSVELISEYCPETSETI